jgi:flagellar basal-body rod protein FlgB
MTSSNLNLIDILVQKMAYLNQKQAVLAENVANADTPGYKERDVKPFTFDHAMQQASMTMAVTDPRHIVPAAMSGVNAQTFIVKDGETMPSGNSVDLEGQMMAVSKTAGDYQSAASLYHKMIGLMKIAIKGTSTG